MKTNSNSTDVKCVNINVDDDTSKSSKLHRFAAFLIRVLSQLRDWFKHPLIQGIFEIWVLTILTFIIYFGGKVIFGY